VEPYDCLVIGGGPAGSTVGALVAEAGYRTLVVERDRFPRFHVGESLMPATYDVFRRLGVLDQMKASSFVHKASVQFVSHTGKESQPFHFRLHDPHERSRTWQVERSRFDAMLFDNAAAKGAECRDGTRVLKVEFDGDRARGARIRFPDGRERVVMARTVVDATGQQTLIAGSLGLKRPNRRLRKASVWGYFRGAWRAPGEDGGATVILHTRNKEAWFWSIPLAEEKTSVGVVGDVDRLLQGQASPADIFVQQRGLCPAVDQRLAGAEQIGPLHVAKEFSYRTTRAAGDGWVLVGDAWGFIDPVYSSGVFFALKSGEMAADCLIEGLAKGDTSAGQLGGWTAEFSAATVWIRKLVDAFYTKPFRFGRFLQAYPQHKGRLTDLLIGRIFQTDAGALFRDLDPLLKATGEPQRTIPQRGTRR